MSGPGRRRFRASESGVRVSRRPSGRFVSLRTATRPSMLLRGLWGYREGSLTRSVSVCVMPQSRRVRPCAPAVSSRVGNQDARQRDNGCGTRSRNERVRGTSCAVEPVRFRSKARCIACASGRCSARASSLSAPEPGQSPGLHCRCSTIARSLATAVCSAEEGCASRLTESGGRRNPCARPASRPSGDRGGTRSS
jgi:hypothetical protein